jgi:DNA-binding NtrC family response regulator
MALGTTLRAATMPEVLIISDHDSDMQELKVVFQQAGLASEVATSMTAGCESAISGRFQVLFSSPLMADGSWRRLIEVADHHALNFEVILLARSFDLNQWGEALQVGAFDVLDVLYDLPKAAETARRALGAHHLKRFRAACH